MSTGAFTRNSIRRLSLPLLAVGLLIGVIVFLALLETHSDTVRESATEEFCCFCPSSRVQWEFVLPAVALIVMAGYGLAFSLERGLKYAIARKQSREFLSKAADALYHHRTNEAVALSLALLDQMVSASENRLQPTTGARYLTQELHPLPTHRLAD
jgi:hypothetical protein